MGYLLKEVLKTLCGVNQWSYAVFWKIGCRNPKLLIWEDCYYEPASCSGLSGNENQNYDASNLQPSFQAGDKVHLLVNKMMMDSHVNIVGEGLVGRVAFTGQYQWILSENYHGEAHSPEVLKEVCQQISAGMRTVAVIPVLPHGVVQFGSFKTIMENMGFVNDVTSLILQLGLVSGVLLSANYEAKEHSPRTGVPIGSFSHASPFLESNGFTAPCSFDSFNYVGNSSQNTMNASRPSFSLAGEILNVLPSNGAAFQASNSSLIEVAKAEVIPSNPEVWKNQHTSLYNPRTSLDVPSTSSSALNCSTAIMEPKNLSGSGNRASFSTPDMSCGVIIPSLGVNSGLMSIPDDGSVNRSSVEVNGHGMNNSAAYENINSECPISSEPENVMFHKVEASNSASVSDFTSDSLLAHKFGNEHINMAEVVPGFKQDDRKQKVGGQISYINDTTYGTCVQQELGDDLFDILGPDLKNKMFSSCWNSSFSNESAPNVYDWDSSNQPSKKSVASSEIYSINQGNSESGIFSSGGSDHLLEAVVSKIQSSTKPSMDDTVSCRTTITNMSSSSVPNTSLPYGRFGVSDHLKGELFGVPKYLVKAGVMSSKEESRAYSQGSSIYGSKLSSWIEKDQKEKPSNSLSTGHSKKPDETGKTNRKRLKPGENPRPRPKDRQMIQDRVKELREIVPNGAKCSIDALLERTIKHMLFLQSVTKHADKLKQSGESKIMSKDGGLLLKDNFEGGATWAYEVGSQSMVCPIIVEDLNQPRQMLVEMLCEERGLFLEIADIIRGLGLTILKGVMETRNDMIWARFSVEANRDVTRMEIFISLVRLLEQTAKTGVAQPNGITSESLMLQQFHQAAIPIPVNARSCSLQ